MSRMKGFHVVRSAVVLDASGELGEDSAVLLKAPLSQGPQLFRGAAKARVVEQDMAHHVRVEIGPHDGGNQVGGCRGR
jgi:hypothetical protein